MVSSLISITNGYANGVWWSSIITSLSLGGIFDFITYVRNPLGWCAAIAFGQFALFIFWDFMKYLITHVIAELKEHRCDYVKRCIYLLFPVILVAFLYLIYAPYEVFFANPSDMGSLIFTDFWWIFVVAFVCFVLIAVLILSFFTGRVFRWVSCLVFGLGIASYVQMMFLNGGLGILDGNIPSALTDPVQLGVNILIWAVILAIPLVLNHFVPNILDNVVRYGSLIVTVLLLVSVIFMVVTAPVSAFDRQDSYYLSAEDQFVLSSNDNVIMFIVDYDSNNYFDALVAEDPSVLEVFKDFTYYNNADSVYMGTFPSVNHMLTGYPIDTTVTVGRWYIDSWSSNSATYFYQSLSEKGYIRNIYTTSYSTPSEMVGKVSNLVMSGDEFSVKLDELFSSFLQTSLYKLYPNLGKVLIYSDVAGTDYINFALSTKQPNRAYTYGNVGFYNRLCSEGLSLRDNVNVFVVHHISGTHPPSTTSEYCTFEEDATTMDAQKGCIILLSEYITQMKELGIYDDATIIITSDHGDFYKDCQPVFLIKEPQTIRDEMAVNNAPITHMELLPTILKNIDVSYFEIGPSIYDIPESDLRERSYYVRAYDSTYPDIPKYNSNTRASANVYKVYRYSGDRYMLDSVIASGEYEVVPMLQGLF